MKKTIGAFALSTALVFGCAVPAFAADEYGTNVGTTSVENVEQGDSVSTDVKVATIVTNINVAVPLNVTIVADAASNNVLAPSSGLKNYNAGVYDSSATTGYRIENYSPFPIKIADIATRDASDGNWALVNATVLGAETATGKVGDLNLTLTPAQKNSMTNGSSQITKNEGNMDDNGGTTGVNLADVLITGDATSSGTDPKWIVDRKVSDDEPAILGLLLAGSNSILKNVNPNSILLGSAGATDNPDPDPVAADDAFKIIYTVSATSLATA